jgi:hypothetical protein
MINGTITRGALAALLALAAAAPVAQAKPDFDSQLPVCNQATPTSLGGTLTATDGDPLPPARFRDELLKQKPGNGKGLVNAASHSPALSVCGVADDGGTTDPGDGGTTDPGDGVDPGANS